MGVQEYVRREANSEAKESRHPLVPRFCVGVTYSTILSPSMWAVFVGIQFINCMATRIAATTDAVSQCLSGNVPIANAIATSMKRMLATSKSSDDVPIDQPLPVIANDRVYANKAKAKDSQTIISTRDLREKFKCSILLG